MKNIIFVIICLALVLNSYSQTGDAKYNKIIKEYTLNKDGSIDFHYVKSIELLSHFSFHRLYGETFIIYNTDFQKLSVNSSATIMADGKKIVTPKNAYNEVLPRVCNNSPYYNNIREMVVTHTGLEVGSTINLDYTIHSDPGFYPTLMGNELIYQSSPVEEMTIRVSIPDNLELRYELLNMTLDPVINTKNGKKIYEWSFKSLPATSKEYYQEHYNTLSPRLVFSTFNMKDAINSFVSQEAFDYMNNESMNKTVGDIVSTETDKLKVALEIQKVVSNNLGSLNIPLKYTGFRCRNAIETWNSNQGTRLEKAILLTSLLSKAGIDAEPIATVPLFMGNTEIGDLLDINTFMVKINIKKLGEFYLNPTKVQTQNQVYKLGGNIAFSLDNNIKKLKSSNIKNVSNIIDMNAMLNLSDSTKLLGEVDLKLTNNTNPFFSLYNDSANIKTTLKNISGIKKSQIIKLSQKESKSKITFEFDNPTSKQGSYNTYKLPFVSGGVDSWHMNLLTSDRSAPVEIPEIIEEKYQYAIVLPKGAKMVSNSTFKVISNDVGSIMIKFEQNENEVIIIREIKLKKKIISINEYPDLKKVMDIWNTEKYRVLMFK